MSRRIGNVCVFDVQNNVRAVGPLHKHGPHYRVGSVLYKFPGHWREGEKRWITPRLQAMRTSVAQVCTDAYYLLGADF